MRGEGAAGTFLRFFYQTVAYVGFYDGRGLTFHLSISRAHLVPYNTHINLYLQNNGTTSKIGITLCLFNWLQFLALSCIFS